jgi:predicted PurR-regulated permease PerM
MTPVEDVREWRMVYGAILLLVVAALLYSLLPSLSPVILFFALLALMSPLRASRYYGTVLLTFAALVVFWLLRALGSLLAPFILAIVISYILDPLVDRIEARGVKRPLAVAILVLPLLLIVIAIVVFGIPALVRQAQEVIDKVPAAIERFILWLQATRDRLQRIPFLRGVGLSRALDSFSPERLTAFLQERQAAIAQHVWTGVLGLGKGVGTILSILGYVVLVPVLIIYLLLDFDSAVQRTFALVPPALRARWQPLLREYDTLLGRYFRGQLIEATIVGLLTWLGLLIAGFPYSGFVGAVAGVFNLVPYLGLVVSALPALVIAILSGNVVISLIKVAIVFGVVQVIDGTVTGPRIVGGSVGLHPVWVILALSVGGFFFGFAGLLLAMPAGVLIKLLLREGLLRYRASTIYRGKTIDTNEP